MSGEFYAKHCLERFATEHVSIRQRPAFNAVVHQALEGRNQCFAGALDRSLTGAGLDSIRATLVQYYYAVVCEMDEDGSLITGFVTDRSHDLGEG